ncbi:MAG: hypothetical protein AAF216_09640 [Pseudomonadota bacterium]
MFKELAWLVPTVFFMFLAINPGVAVRALEFLMPPQAPAITAEWTMDEVKSRLFSDEDTTEHCIAASVRSQNQYFSPKLRDARLGELACACMIDYARDIAKVTAMGDRQMENLMVVMASDYDVVEALKADNAHFYNELYRQAAKGDLDWDAHEFNTIITTGDATQKRVTRFHHEQVDHYDSCRQLEAHKQIRFPTYDATNNTWPLSHAYAVDRLTVDEGVDLRVLEDIRVSDDLTPVCLSVIKGAIPERIELANAHWMSPQDYCERAFSNLVYFSPRVEARHRPLQAKLYLAQMYVFMNGKHTSPREANFYFSEEFFAQGFAPSDIVELMDHPSYPETFEIVIRQS